MSHIRIRRRLSPAEFQSRTLSNEIGSWIAELMIKLEMPSANLQKQKVPSLRVKIHAGHHTKTRILPKAYSCQNIR